jgi:hypothetical protein
MRGVNLPLLIALVAVSLVVAGVFTYYPTTVNVNPTSPKVTFQLGSNAGNPDLSGNIEVSVGQNSTSATITVNPTYQTTYYENILKISNADTKAYNVYLDIDTVTNTLPSGSKVVIYVYDAGASRDLAGWDKPAPVSGSYVAEVDLTSTSTNTPVSIGTLNGGSSWEIDILVYIPEGTSINGASATFNMYLIASPESLSPP